MLRIGITGGIGSGKSSAVALFKQYGASIIDSDAIARKIVQPYEPAYEKIVSHFSPLILDKEKNIDRKKLRQIIFENNDEKKWLESLLHPLIRQEIKKQCEHVKTAYVIIDIPLLNDPKDFPYLDRILVIDCPEKLQLERITQRDNISQIEAKRMIHAQISRQQRNAFADDYMLNDTKDFNALKVAIQKLHECYSNYSLKENR